MKWLDRPWSHHPMQVCPHKSSRLGAAIDAIVLHYTAGGSHDGTVRWFLDPAAKASAHFVVGRGGEIIQVVPLDERAWHVGKARFEVGGVELVEAVDRSAVGIEIANYGMLMRQGNDYFFERGRDMVKYDTTKYGMPVYSRLDFIDNTKSPDIEAYWEPYPKAQVEAVVKLCEALLDEFKIPLKRIVGHEDVAYPQGRKTDPGPLWPWTEFMELLAGSKSRQCQPLPADVWALHKTVVR
jgi:N-acetylmuramoyl-L-alanine amidase